MNNTLFEGDIEEPYERLIEECHWRKDVGGVYVCVGECRPCSNVINSGDCDVLKEYFAKKG